MQIQEITPVYFLQLAIFLSKKIPAKRKIGLGHTPFPYRTTADRLQSGQPVGPGTAGAPISHGAGLRGAGAGVFVLSGFAPGVRIGAYRARGDSSMRSRRGLCSTNKGTT